MEIKQSYLLIFFLLTLKKPQINMCFILISIYYLLFIYYYILYIIYIFSYRFINF